MFLKTRILYLLALSLLVSCVTAEVESDRLAVELETSIWDFENKHLRMSLKNGFLTLDDSFREDEPVRHELAIERIVLSSTTQLVYFQSLDALDKVVGCPWLDFVQDEEIQEQRARGKIIDVTKGAGLDLEKIISLDPDILLYDPREMDLVPRLEAAGIICIPFVEYLESKPIDRVMWLDLVGVLCQKKELAFELSDSINAAYTVLEQNDSPARPQVLFGSYYQGVWSVSGGGSLISQMIRDAGGELVIQGEESSSVDIDSEEFFELLEKSDHIGMIQQGQLSREEWLALDPRIDDAMIEDKVIFYCNTLESDYFGRGVLEPHIMLNELKEIFFGEASSGRYFQIAE